MKEKFYVISNYGEYLSSIYNSSCGWTSLITCSMILKSYAKAYSLMRKINKLYGFNKCRVERLEEKDWNGYAWNQITSIAT